jgi:hypothetical protein
MFKESILIVADFGRYPKEIARLRKDVVAPYEHVVPTFEEDNGKDPYMSRKILLFFRGRIQRKDVCTHFLVPMFTEITLAKKFKNIPVIWCNFDPL